MKTSIIICSILLLGSCSSAIKDSMKSKKNDIIYILPRNISEALQRSVLDERHDHTAYFCMYTVPNGYRITAGYIFKDSKMNAYAKRTNRKLFINGRFYPLIFESDLLFAAVNPPSSIKKAYDLGDSVLAKRYFKNYDGFEIVFDKEGLFVDSGGLYINDNPAGRYFEIRRN